MSVPRILILMSDTGGGHRASAEALHVEFAEKYGEDVHISIVDPWTQYAPWPLNQLPKLYPIIVQRVSWLWLWLWRLTKAPMVTTPLFGLVALWVRRAIRRLMHEYQPDLIIHVHPIVQTVFSRLMPSIQLQAKCITVVTDLTCPHPLWFQGQTDHCFVATQAAYVGARAAGLAESQLTLGGLPVHSKFSAVKFLTMEFPSGEFPIVSQQRTQLRYDLGLLPDLPMVLLMGGGDGVGAIFAIARAVSNALSDGDVPIGQLVVVCGRNRALYTQLRAEDWSVPTKVYGFEENLHEWMAVCDCMITKAGPGAIAEAQVLGIPLIVSGFIPGQEEGNVDYVLGNGIGSFCTDPKEIGQMVRSWFTDECDELCAMRQNAQRLGKPHATKQIVDVVEELGFLRLESVTRMSVGDNQKRANCS